jgi:hypothetical protein
MGIPTDPGYRLYVNDNICFPTGKTPKKIYLTLQNVKAGPLWDNTCPAPPNQTFLLEYANGIWEFYGATWIASFYCGDILSEVYVSPRQILYPAYKSTQLIKCKFTGVSEFVEGDNKVYICGNHIASPRD